MKDRASCVVRRAVLAAGLVVVCHNAVASTWTGNGDGVKWSDSANWDTVPGKGSAITFPAGSTAATVVDADFTKATLGDVTLASGFAGSVTLQRPLSIASFKIEDGTWDQDGNAQTNTGHAYFYGGTYKFRGTSLVLRAGNYSTVHKSACTLQGGHLRYERNQNHSITFADGSTFESVRLGAGPESNVDVAARKDNTMGIYGAWTITGDLVLEAFQFTRTGSLTVGGDVYVRHHANGGSPTIYFTDGGEHEVKFDSDVAGYEPGCLGVVASNGTTVVVSSEYKRARFGRLSASDPRAGANPVAVRAINGSTIDFTGLDEVTYAQSTSDGNYFGVTGNGVMLMPPKVVFKGGTMTLLGSGLVFNDLQTEMIRLGVGLQKGTTNYVNGTLSVHGNGFSCGAAPASIDDPAMGTLLFTGDFVCTTNHYVGYPHAANDYNYDRWGASDGFGRLVAAGSGDQHGWITNGCLGAALVVDKPEGTKLVFHQAEGPLTVYRGTGKSKASPAVVVRRGTFVSSDIKFKSCYGESGFYQYAGSTLVATNSAFEFCDRPQHMRFLDPIGTLTLNAATTSDHNLTVRSGETTTVVRALNHIKSYYITPSAGNFKSPHVFDLKGDLYIASNCTLGASGDIHFTGTNDQHYVNAYPPTSKNFLGDIVIDKPAGKVVLDSDYFVQRAYNWCGKGKILNAEFRRGTLDLNGHVCNVGGTLKIGKGMKIVSGGGDGVVATNTVTVADGATLAFAPREENAAQVPIVTAVNALSLPNGADEAVCVQPLAKVTHESATTIPLFSYGSFAQGHGYASDKWSFDLQPMMIRPRVENDVAEKLVDFVYRYKHGMLLYLR
ncbi:MAG: hypothetical protein J6T01_00960 [Kiritimatiellae bacterium]|nr:hypothetical protein [Kiritimatiellia bacterium]